MVPIKAFQQGRLIVVSSYVKRVLITAVCNPSNRKFIYTLTHILITTADSRCHVYTIVGAI